MQTTIAGLEAQICDIQQMHEISVQNLWQQQEALETRLQDYQKLHISNEDNAKRAIELKLQHADAIASLQRHLVDSETAFGDLQIRHKSAELDQGVGGAA